MDIFHNKCHFAQPHLISPHFCIEMSCHSLHGLIRQFHLTTDSSLLHIGLKSFKITVLSAYFSFFLFFSVALGAKNVSLMLNNPTLKT